MGEFDRRQHRRFGQLIRPCFDHHDRIGRPRHDELQFASLHRFQVRIDDELAIDPTDPDACDGTEERNVGYGQGRGGGGNADDVGRACPDRTTALRR